MNSLNQPANAIERFNPSPDCGLTAEQVNKRITQKLTNSVEKKYSKSYLNIIYNNVCTFFNLLGLIVLVALLVFGKDDVKLSNFFFVIIFMANILIGIVQEIRAKHCIDKLSLITGKSTKVLRDGKIVEIAPKDVVLDDVIVLGLGNQIPADCVLIDGEAEVNESLLTGESDAVKKRVGDRLLAGSFITSGTCKAQAEKIGKENYVETLSEKAKKYKKPHSEIMDSMKLFIKAIGVAIVPIATLFMIKSTLLTNPSVSISKAVLSASTVVIGMIPSGMFLLTSLALAVGIIKLARHKTLVQDLYSLEMLARVDTICFDKTGTITDGKMTVESVKLYGNEKIENVQSVIGSMMSVLKDNNQTAIALNNYFGTNNDLSAETVLPFNSSRKLSAVSFKDNKTFSFGAPEFVLSKDEFENIKEDINAYAKKGYRVLILAESGDKIKNDTLPTNFKPIAAILIVDHIREDAISTVAWFKENGVAIKVISGDNPVTVAEVSSRVGIEHADKYISLEGLSDEEVEKCANEYTVFGRVTPEQKAILIKAIKTAGHVTAMTGDGVNDILALKEADCAISVASGSDAARNISHLVLMDNNFNSMPKVVYEGRRVINNVQSSASLYLMKTFFTMIFAIIALCCMPSYPFQLNQMILLETFVIGVPSFFLSFQANDKKVEGHFISYVIGKSLPSALLMVLSVSIVEIFQASLNYFEPEVYTTMSVFVLTFSGVINLFMICKPLNLYRTILFSINFAVVFAVFVITIFNGFPILEYVKMTPFSVYWHHLLIVVSIILLDVPLAYLFQIIFKNVNLDKLVNKNKKTA